jgi:hypothetical protein
MITNRMCPPRAKAHQLRAAARPAMIRVAPNLYAPDPACPKVPEFSIGKYVEVAPDKFQFVPVLENFVRVSDEMLKKLGIARQWRTLVRLARAGFVEMIQIAPHTYLLNLDSYYGHVARCAEEGEDFWGKPGNLEQYRRAL